MIFDDWTGLVRVLIVGTLAYGALIAILRVSGKRTLTKLNAFDLVVTVALGSTLASIVTSESVALLEGVLALCLLVGLQAGIAWLSVSSPRFRALVKSEPSLLLHDGAFLPAAMKQQRITEEEVAAAVRAAGLAEPGAAAAVILETDGGISVIGPRPS